VAYIGRPSIVGNFVKLDAITAVNGQAAYTMQNSSVNFTDYSTVNQFLVSLNGTIQSPGSSFTVSGSTLTFASNLSTGDVIDFIIVFGNSLSAGTPTDATVTTAKIVDANVTAAKLASTSVTAAKLNNDIISGTTELASEPADTDEFLVSDAGTLKRIDYSLIKGGGGMTLLTSGSTTSTTSQINITGTHVTSTYDHYKLYLSGKAAADNIAFHMRFRNAADNGNIESGYSWKITALGADADTANNNSDSRIRLTNQTYLGAGVNEGFNMIIDFMSPNSNTVPTMANWIISGSSQSDTLAVQQGGSRRNDGTETHKGFTLFFDSGGDFASFDYQFYGINKS
jgi:hypothetical protein